MQLFLERSYDLIFYKNVYHTRPTLHPSNFEDSSTDMQ